MLPGSPRRRTAVTQHEMGCWGHWNNTPSRKASGFSHLVDIYSCALVMDETRKPTRTGGNYPRHKIERDSSFCLAYLKPPVVRSHVVAHRSQKTDVSHRRPVDVVEWSILKRLELLEFVFTRPALRDNQNG